MIKRPTFSYNENKHLLEFKSETREQVRPKAVNITDISAAERKRFLEIAQILKKKFPECTPFAHGSRVNGNFVEDSDYDVAIMGLTSDQLIEARKMFGSDVDITGVRQKLDFMIAILPEYRLNEMLSVKNNE